MKSRNVKTQSHNTTAKKKSTAANTKSTSKQNTKDKKVKTATNTLSKKVAQNTSKANIKTTATKSNQKTTKNPVKNTSKNNQNVNSNENSNNNSKQLNSKSLQTSSKPKEIKKVPINNNNTLSKKSKTISKESSPELSVDDEVISMTSEMMKSMNEKIQSLESVKKNLEDKLKEIDSKVAIKENSTSQLSDSNAQQISPINKKQYDLISSIQPFLQYLHSSFDSHHIISKKCLNSLDAEEQNIENVLTQINKKNISHKKFVELYSKLKTSIQNIISTLLHELSTNSQVIAVNTMQSKQDNSKLFKELQVSKQYLEHLINNKANTNELYEILKPIEKRIENAFSVINNVESVDSKQFSTIKKTLENEVKSIHTQIELIEKNEKEHITKTQYHKDMNKVLEEVETMLQTLQKTKITENVMQNQISQLQIFKDELNQHINSIKNRQSKEITKEEVSNYVASIENQINNVFKALEKSKQLENNDMKSVKSKLNSQQNQFSTIFETLHKEHTQFITKNLFQTYQKSLQNEIQAIIETLKKANSKDKSIENKLKTLQLIEQSLEKNQQDFKNSISKEIQTKVPKQELETFNKKVQSKINDVLGEISQIASKEDSDISSIKQKVNTRVVAIQNKIDEFNKLNIHKEHIINQHISIIDSKISAIINTLQKASKKEKKLETLLKALQEDDEEEKKEIEKIQKKFSTYYTKKQLNSLLEQINTQYEGLKNQVSSEAKRNSSYMHELEHSLHKQREELEKELNELNTTSHKTFATKQYTSKKLKDLKALEEEHSKLQEEQVSNIKKHTQESNTENMLRVEALRNSLTELYQSSHQFMNKDKIKSLINEVNTKLNSLTKKENLDSKEVETHLHNLAKTFSKEISTLSNTINTLSTQKDVEKVKTSFENQVKKIHSQINKTQENISNKAIEQSNNLQKEHEHLIKVESFLTSKIEHVQVELLKEYYTKKEIDSFKKELKEELNNLHSLQDASIQIVEDELTNLSQTAQNHQKELSKLNKKIKSDEDIMSSHQEVIDVASALKQTLTNSKAQITKKANEQKNQLLQEIKALLEGQAQREQKVQQLSNKVSHTYSKNQLDKAFEDVADEVERIKLHEKNEEQKLHGDVNQIRKKEKEDITNLTNTTQALQEQTSIQYLKDHLTNELEKRINEIKEEQYKHIKELEKLHSQEKRLDKTEHLIEEREEQIEEKIQNQFNELEKAKSHWEEFFSNIQQSVEEDEASLNKALSSIEVLKKDLKQYGDELSELKKSQTPLKQYLVDKYNILVDAFHTMQKERSEFEKELQSRQDEIIASKFNQYYQEIANYRSELENTQDKINQIIDSKTHATYEEFENTMKNYKQEYSQEIYQVQQSINQYLEQIKVDEKKFTDLMSQYIESVNTKIEEVNELETNFDTLLHKARKEVDEYIQSNIESINSTFDTMLNEKTDSFLQKESELLHSYHSKIQKLEDHINNRLDSIEHKFVEKNISSIKDTIKEESQLVDEKIEELHSLKSENESMQQNVEQSLLSTIESLEEKKNTISKELEELSQNTKDEFKNYEERANNLDTKISQTNEERITQFEQHLNKRYLEIESKISYIKEVLIDEVEGMMRDVSQDINSKKEEIDSFMQSTLGVNSFSEEVNNLRDKLAQLESSQEGMNAQFALPRDDDFTNSIDTNSLRQEINDLQSRIEANSALLAIGVKGKPSKKGLEFEEQITNEQQSLIDMVQSLNEEVNKLRLDYTNLQNRVEANASEESVERSNPSTKQVLLHATSDDVNREIDSSQQFPQPPQPPAPSDNNHESLLDKIKHFTTHLFHASEKIEKSENFNREENTELQSQIQDKIESLNSIQNEVKQSPTLNEENKDKDEMISFKELTHYNSAIQKEIKTILSILRSDDSKTDELKQNFENLQTLKNNLENSEKELGQQVNTKSSREEVSNQVREIYSKIEELLSSLKSLKAELDSNSQDIKKEEQKNRDEINQQIATTAQNLRQIIQEIREKETTQEQESKSQFEKVESEIAEIISTLKRASEKEHSLENIIHSLEGREAKVETNTNHAQQNQNELFERLSKIETVVSRLQSQVHANSVFETFQNDYDRKLRQLFKNQEQIAHKMKKSLLDVKNMMFETHTDMSLIKKEFQEIKEDTHYTPVEVETTSHKLIHSMKQYEDELLESIEELHNRGHSKDEIIYILAQKGHPQFYVSSIIEYM